MLYNYCVIIHYIIIFISKKRFEGKYIFIDVIICDCICLHIQYFKTSLKTENKYILPQYQFFAIFSRPSNSIVCSMALNSQCHKIVILNFLLTKLL